MPNFQAPHALSSRYIQVPPLFNIQYSSVFSSMDWKPNKVIMGSEQEAFEVKTTLTEGCSWEVILFNGEMSPMEEIQ